jgi:non-specific serine/threonine protein kinase
LRVADEMAQEFPAGVAFVPLAPVRSAELVLPTIAQVLGVQTRDDQPIETQLRIALRDRELLLLLDNLEQVTAVAPALADLLDACPRLTMLVTSRKAVHLSGEQVYPVPALTLPSGSVSLGGTRDLPPLNQLAAVDAIRLFLERAAAAASFVLTPENAPAVVTICERLEGWPLAIELAAVRTRVLSAEDLLGRLSPQLALLSGGPADQPARLQTMRGAIAWSYDLLSPAEQTLFRRLAVFVGGFTLDAAEAVGGRCAQAPPSVLELLTALVDQNLVQRVPGPGHETRFGMLEPVREFGLERLRESWEEASVRNAHTAWCLAFAERADPELAGPDQHAWFDRLEAELPNMRAALSWLQDRGDAERGLRLASSLSWFWSSRGYLREARAWLDAFLGMPTSAPTRGLGLMEAATILQWQGDDDRALVLIAEALRIFRELGDERNAAYALRGRASIAIDRGDHEQAAVFLAESSQVLQSAGTAWDGAFAIYLAGRLAAATGQSTEAGARSAEAAAAFDAIGDRGYVAAALGYQGAASLRQGDLATARAAYAQSLQLARELNEQSWVAWALAGGGHLAHLAGDSATAARLLGAATAIAEATGERERPDAALIDAVRSTLGADRFAREWQHGVRLSEPQVIAEAQAVFSRDDRQLPWPEGWSMPPPLTGREREVLRLLVTGLSDKEIAVALGITRPTASRHVAAIRRKLGVPSRTAAAALAVQTGLLAP